MAKPPKVWNDKSVADLAKALATAVPGPIMPPIWTDGGMEVAKIYYLPAKVMWLEKTLADIQVMFDGISYEVTGIILVDPEAKLTEVTRREALTVLMTRFLRLVEELEKKEVLMDKLPEIVIGDVGGRYSAQVTLKLGHLSTEASVTAIDTGWLPEPPKAPFPTWNPLKPNAYLVDEVPEANWPKPGWKKKIA